MKLLLDQSLSHQLLADLEPHFPGSTHVRAHGLERADDPEVWAFARDQGFAVVTQDADLRGLDASLDERERCLRAEGIRHLAQAVPAPAPLL